MPTLQRDYSNQRSNVHSEEQFTETGNRALDHYYRYNDRKRPPSYLIQEDYVSPPGPGYQDSPDRKRPSYNDQEFEMSADHPDEPRTPARQPTTQSKGQSPSHNFTPTTPTKQSTGPLEIEIPPMSAQSAETINSFFTAYFTAILSICTLGASITFNYILNGNFRAPSPDSHFNKSELQTFIALAWLFFILGLAFTAACQTLLKFYGTQLKQAWQSRGRRQRLAQWVGMIVSALLLTFVIAAFMFISLIVTAYTAGVGWTAVAFTCIFGIFGLASIIYQAPIWSHQARRF